jgi:hypothetical protein
LAASALPLFSASMISFRGESFFPPCIRVGLASEPYGGCSLVITLACWRPVSAVRWQSALGKPGLSRRNGFGQAHPCAPPRLIPGGPRIWSHTLFLHMHACRRYCVPSSRRGHWPAKLVRNAVRDKGNHRKLRQFGWRVKVIWECQIGHARESRLCASIAAFLGDEAGRPSRKKPC